jgi:hypothetical protein
MALHNMRLGLRTQQAAWGRVMSECCCCCCCCCCCLVLLLLLQAVLVDQLSVITYECR